MKILVTIPILNPDEKSFRPILEILSKQSKANEILLINSGQNVHYDLPCKIINIDKKDFNHANTRNIVLNYEADYYLFMTQDALPCDETLLESLLKAFVDDDVVVSYARQIPYNDANICEYYSRSTNYPAQSKVKSKQDIKSMGIKAYFSSDSCAMYRGDYFRSVGGFTKDLNASEDMEFAARAIWDNKKIAYCAEARVFHSHNYTLKSLFKRYLLIGKFMKQNAWIEQSVASIKPTNSLGKEFALGELRYIFKHKASMLPYSFMATCIKYIAYSIGEKSK